MKRTAATLATAITDAKKEKHTIIILLHSLLIKLKLIIICEHTPLLSNERKDLSIINGPMYQLLRVNITIDL